MFEVKKIGEAELKVCDKVCRLPIVEGTEGERAIEITKLRAETGCITLDYGYMSTGACKSAITYLDGEKGILRYRGYPVELLAEKCRFTEVSYLLVHGRFPSRDEASQFSKLLNQHSMIHEDMVGFFRNFPEGAHPMAMLSAMVVSLSSFYPELGQSSLQENIDMATTRILSKVRTIAAFSYKKSIGEPCVYPRHDLRYCANFLNMMFSSPVNP